MEHLLRYTANQPLHYQYYYRGYYYMSIRHQPERAAPLFREAAALAPPGQMAPKGITYHSRYLRMLGYTLADMGLLEEAIDIIEESLLRKDDPAHKRELRQALDKLYTLRKEAP